MGFRKTMSLSASVGPPPLLLLLVLLVLTSCLSSAYAQTSLSLFVSPTTGSDANAGTDASAPLRTLRGVSGAIQRNSAPQIASIVVTVDAGTYSDPADCEFELVAPAHNLSLALLGNGTAFSCAQLASLNATVQARIAGFDDVAISSLAWSDLVVECAASPCAALLVDGADRVALDDVTVRNVSLLVPLADDSWSLVAPVAVRASLVVNSSLFQSNRLLLNVTTSANDAFLFPVGGGALAVRGHALALAASTFDSNQLVSLTAGRVVGGGAVFVDESATKIDVAGCTFRNNSVSSDGNAIGGVFAVRTRDTGLNATLYMRVNNSLFDANYMNSTDPAAQFQGVAIGGVSCNDIADKSLVALVAENTRFVNNYIEALGGANTQATGGVVRVHSLHATNCSVANITLSGVASVKGGFVALQGVSSVSSCSFVGNAFDAINVNGALVLIDDSDGHACTGSDMFTFIDNTVTHTSVTNPNVVPGGVPLCGGAPTGGGGVIRIDLARCRTDVVNIQGGVFAENSLKYCTGGAVSITGGDISFMGVLVANNVARAGAVFEGHLLSSVDIDSSQFENNTADRVGGVGSFYDVTFLAVHNNTFRNNSASDRGGVFYLETVASVVIDGSSMVKNMDAFNMSVHFISLHAMSISVKGHFVGNGLLLHGPVKELLVGDSLFVESPILLTYDFGSFLVSSNYRFVDSTFQGASTIVVADSGDRMQASFVLRVALTLLNCRFLIYDRGPRDALSSRGSVCVTSLLSHTMMQNCTFTGTGSGSLAPIYVMQNEKSALMLLDCRLVRTAAIVARSTIELTNTTFDNCNGVLWAQNLDYVSMYRITIRDARVGSMANTIEIADAEQIMLTDVVVADSVAGGQVMRLHDIGIVQLDGLTVVNTSVLQAMSTVVQLVNVSRVFTFNRVSIVNNTFAVGALTLGKIGLLTGHNVTVANNTATVCGGVMVIDDAATVANVSIEASGNRALCFGNDTVLAPVRVGLVGARGGGGGGTPVVYTMRGVQARVTAQLVDPLNFSAPDCAQPMRSSPLNVLVAVGNASSTIMCAIPRNSSQCTGSVWFDGDVGESVAVTVAVNASGDALPHWVAPLTFRLAVAECLAGYALQDTRCVECQSASYSFGGAEACRSCPVDAVCRGGSAFESANDTFVAWNANATDVEVHRCLLGVCGGGAVTSNLTVVNRCAPGRTGLLCASCEQRPNATFVPVAPSSGGAACVECNGTNVPVVIALVVALFGTALFLHLSAHSSSAKTKLLFYYAQIAAIVLPPDFPSDVVTHVLNIRVGAATGAFGGICVANLDHFDLVTVKLLLPLALIACLFVTFVAMHLWRRLTTHRRARRVRRATVRVQVEVDPVATEQSEGCETASAIPLAPSADEALAGRRDRERGGAGGAGG
jgi:hypothetical protein